MSKTFGIIKEMSNYRDELNAILDYSILKKRVLSKGISEDTLQITIQQYERLNMIIRYPNGDISLAELMP